MTPSRKFATHLLLALLNLGGAGCHRQKVQAAAPPPVTPPAEANPQPTPAPPPTAAQPEGSKPATPTEEAPVNPAPESHAHKPATPRPHVNPNPAPPVIPETPPAPKPAPPQIRPRLSPAQVAEYKRKTNEAMAEAEKNLQSVYGRPLIESQRDLVEKIRGFLNQAREAGDAEDWGRAANLAEKARLLSIELVNSL